MSEIKEYINGTGKNKPRKFVKDGLEVSIDNQKNLNRGNGYRIETPSREEDRDR